MLHAIWRKTLAVSVLLCSIAGPSASLAAGEPISEAIAVERLRGLMASGTAVPEAELLPLYEALPPVDIAFMLGTWRGGKFDGGAEPDPIGWYGKRFDSREHAEPLLARKPDGSIYAYTGLGAARLRMAEFRGSVTATLIYDRQPIMDYFRRIDANTVIGAGEVKGKPGLMFFHLHRETAGR